jgi:hypothetical protein
MATLLHMLRGPEPALAVSVPNLLASRANFLNNVVPAFPAAKAFTPHFFDSYALIKSVSQESKEPLPVGFGLLSLGVKGYELLPASFSKPLLRHIGLLEPLGLCFHMTKSGEMEVFNPAIIRPQLEAMLKKPLPTSHALNEGLVQFARLNLERPLVYSYELLGWPSLVSPREIFAINQIDTSSGMLQFPSKQGEFLNAGPLVAAAVAVVEQVMGKLKSLPDMLKTKFLTESTVAQPACEMWA